MTTKPIDPENAELKPCLCGEPVNMVEEAADMYFILCPHPKCKFFSGYHTSAEKVAERWNTRPIEDRYRKALEEIRRHCVLAEKGRPSFFEPLCPEDFREMIEGLAEKALAGGEDVQGED